MAMTLTEAQAICNELRSGKSFGTRYQEDEWGLHANTDGTFQRWSRRSLPDGDESSTDILSEEDLIDLLVTWQGYERIKLGLR